jgi:hypothetical protein
MELVIPEHVYRKVMHWVNKSSIEVSGFGKVVRDPVTGSFEIVEAYLLEQEGGSAHTDIDDKALGKLMYTSKDAPGDLRWWWHSHVRMQTFWSSTDTATIKELGKQGWIVASVFNQMEEIKSALCYQTTSIFGQDLQLHDDIKTSILYNVDEAEIAQWDEEFTAKVKQKAWAQTAFPSLGRDAYEMGAKKVDPYSDDMFYRPDDTKEPGLVGGGLQLEAMILGITVEAYCQKLNNWDYNEIMQFEERLEAAQKTGSLGGAT